MAAVTVGLGETPAAVKVITHECVPERFAAAPVLTETDTVGAGEPVVPLVGFKLSQAQSDPREVLNARPVEELVIETVCAAGAVEPIVYAPKFSDAGETVRVGLVTVIVAVTVGGGETPAAEKVMTHECAPGVAALVLTEAVSVGAGVPVVPLVGFKFSQAQSDPREVLNARPVNELLTVMVCAVGAAAPGAYVPKFSDAGVTLRFALPTVIVAVRVGLGETPEAEKVMTQACAPGVAAAGFTDAVTTGPGVAVTPLVGLNVNHAQSGPREALNVRPVKTLVTVMFCAGGAAVPSV
jgi:hypothetical protein